MHHAEATRLRMEFIEECARRYANHPALYVWDVWNEPELTVGLRREPHVEDLVCYCEHSVKEFRAWLKNKYGAIEKLNEVWGRNYRSFSDCEPSRRRGTTMDMADCLLRHRYKRYEITRGGCKKARLGSSRYVSHRAASAV